MSERTEEKNNADGIINSIMEEFGIVEAVLEENGFIREDAFSKDQVMQITIQCAKIWYINERNIDIARIADALEKLEQRAGKED